jgi:hypothetical protein
MAETPQPSSPTKSFSGKKRCPHGFYGQYCKACFKGQWPKKKGTQAKPTATEKGKAQTAKARAKALESRAMKAGKVVFVDLQYRHYINGMAFGPGTVKVSPDVAATLQEQEQRHITNEQRLHESRAGIILPGYGARVRRVAPESFEIELGKYLG